MKITKKQEQEIHFLSKVFGISSKCLENYKGDKKQEIFYEPTIEEKEQYIRNTVYGEKVIIDNFYNKDATRNRLILTKRLMDITVKMWREGVCMRDLIQDPMYNDPYGKRLIDSIME